MATIDNPKSILQLMKDNGRYSDDPVVDYIVEYTNFGGRRCWGILYKYERHRLGEYIDLNNAVVVFDRTQGFKLLTPALKEAMGK